MATTADIVWERAPITLVPRVDAYGSELMSALGRLLDYFAARIEAYAKQNARWTDRTGAARQGLRAFAETTAAGAVLYLVHSAAHGIWLELSQGGRYAIIGTTLESFYSQIMAAVRRLVGD